MVDQDYLKRRALLGDAFLIVRELNEKKREIDQLKPPSADGHQGIVFVVVLLKYRIRTTKPS